MKLVCERYSNAFIELYYGWKILHHLLGCPDLCALEHIVALFTHPARQGGEGNLYPVGNFFLWPLGRRRISCFSISTLGSQGVDCCPCRSVVGDSKTRQLIRTLLRSICTGTVCLDHASKHISTTHAQMPYRDVGVPQKAGSASSAVLIVLKPRPRASKRRVKQPHPVPRLPPALRRPLHLRPSPDGSAP